MLSPRLYLSVLLLLLASPAWAKLPYSVSIEAPSRISRLLQEHLELISSKDDEDMDQALLDELVRGTPEEVQHLLETEGYFQVKAKVEQDGPRSYRVIVTLGEAVMVDEVNIKLSGPIRQEADFRKRFAAVLEAWALPMGAPYQQAQWDDSKRAILQLVAADRFPTARISLSRADIDPDTQRAELNVEIDSGPLIRFGELNIEGMQRYPEKVAAGQADFSPGTPYSRQKILDYQAALEQSPHFSRAIVSTDFSKIDADHRVPVEVEVTEMPRQKLELGLTYDSSDGLGTRWGYDHYNIFKQGYTGSIRSNINKNQKIFSLGLAFPRQADGYSHSISGTLKDEDVQGLDTRSAQLGAWRIRQRDNIESRIGIEYLKEREDAGNTITTNSHALQMVFGWTQRNVDNLLRPRSGVLWDAQLSATPDQLLSSTAYARAYARTALYWTPNPKYGTLVGRLEVGQVWPKGGGSVPSSILFRAGGSNSVRGYSSQSLGLPGPNGSVLGGKVTAAGSLEYQIPIVRPDWYLALFTDAGNAANSWQDFKLEHSNGVGVRWMSPVAPFALDIAKAQRDGKIRWNLSLGLAF